MEKNMSELVHNLESRVKDLKEGLLEEGLNENQKNIYAAVIREVESIKLFARGCL